MLDIDPRETLASLVTRAPGTAATLDRLGLDYCCGGDRPLADAAHAASLGLDEVLAQLRTAEPAGADHGWSDLSPAELVDHLEGTHHRYLADALPRLDALAHKVADVHGSRHPELLEVRELVAAVRADLEPHLRKEEQVLFPLIRRLADGAAAAGIAADDLAGPISVMDAEHDRAGELLASLRTTTADYAVPSDGCASYRALYEGLADLEADTHLHVHKENNLLFPAVLSAARAEGDGDR